MGGKHKPKPIVAVIYVCVRCGGEFERPSCNGGQTPKYCSRVCKLRKKQDYDLLAVGLRQCKECKATKPLNDFWKRPASKFLVHARCKSCMANKAKASYEKNRAQRIKASADYAKATREAMKPYRARKAAERRAAELRATPRWLSAVQISQIAEFYDIAHARQVQTGVVQHVDHIVPLQGKSVRGLHVPWNLQVLTEAENCSKHNRLLGFQT